MPAKLPKQKRIFGRKPQKNLRRLERFTEKGKILGYLGDKSAISQELELRRTLLEMSPKERTEYIKFKRLRTGGVNESSREIEYSTGDEALRVTRGLLKRHLSRVPNAVEARIEDELNELREKGTIKRLNSDEQVRLRELITIQNRIREQKTKK